MSDEAARKASRERMRERRSDPVFRAAEYAKNREYKRKNHEKVRADFNLWRRSKYRNDPQFRAAHIAQVKANYATIRAQIFAAYGNACVCCGENVPEFLELDHVNGGGAKHFASHKSPVGVYREVLAAGCPPIYRLLCSNCNRGRQRNGGECPHQTLRILHQMLEV